MKKITAVLIIMALLCCVFLVNISANEIAPSDGLSLSEAIAAIDDFDEPRNAPPTSDTVVIAVATLAAAATAAIIISKKR